MSDSRYTLRDLVVEHPAVDHLPPLAAVTAWFFLLRPVEPSHVPEFLVGLATLAGLLLAAATFVCALTYQSASGRVARIRTAYGPQIRRNWTSIFLYSFLAAIAPLVGLLFIGSGPLTPALAIWAGVTLAAKAARTHYWLKTMLFMQYVEDQRPEDIRQIGAGRRVS